MRKETGNPDIFAPIELEKKGAKQLLTVTLMRPLHMIVFEAIVLFTCLYLSLAYVRTSILSTLLVWVESQKTVLRPRPCLCCSMIRPRNRLAALLIQKTV